MTVRDRRPTGTIAPIGRAPRQQGDAMEVSAGDEVSLIIGKQRNGPNGHLTLVWRTQWTRFENGPLPQDPDYPVTGT